MSAARSHGLKRDWVSAVLAAAIGGRWDHVLVDEYQDTNRLQATILLGMKPNGAGMTVVGDDAQSIYAFRGGAVSPTTPCVTAARCASLSLSRYPSPTIILVTS